jgi:UDP-perosamine 4-acetyltransferase
MKKIILVGGGGHCKVIIDAIKNKKDYIIYGITDPRLKKGEKILGIPIIGKDDSLKKIFKKGIRYAFICVGSIGDCSLRRNIDTNLKNIGFKLAIIRHPGAIVAKDVVPGEGTFIAAGAIVNPGTKIGRNVIINTSASVDHDCEIGDFVHIAPGVTLSGGVKVGNETHIGTGANVIQYVKIGEKCMVKAGTLLSQDLEKGKTWEKSDRIFEDGTRPE